MASAISSWDSHMVWRYTWSGPEDLSTLMHFKTANTSYLVNHIDLRHHNWYISIPLLPWSEQKQNWTLYSAGINLYRSRKLLVGFLSVSSNSATPLETLKITLVTAFLMCTAMITNIRFCSTVYALNSQLHWASEQLHIVGHSGILRDDHPDMVLFFFLDGYLARQPMFLPQSAHTERTRVQSEFIPATPCGQLQCETVESLTANPLAFSHSLNYI